MKNLAALFLFVFAVLAAQKTSAQSMFADDYGNFYFYKKENFSLVKTDSAGAAKANFMWAAPFDVLSVQNPLNIALFSQNTQEIRFLDEHLNPIQTIRLSEIFGFVQAAYVEDLQFVWLWDAVNRNISLYNFREKQLIRTFPADIPQTLRNFLVYEGKLYYLTDKSLIIKILTNGETQEFPVENPQRFYRENEKIFILSTNSVYLLSANGAPAQIFRDPSATAVCRNSGKIFTLAGGKIFSFQNNK